MQTIAERLATLPQVGRLEWIGLRRTRRGDVESVSTATLILDQGLEGDHSTANRPGGDRQVTLIQAEHLVAIAGYLHLKEISPGILRRNLLVSGINLLALKGREFQIGSCRLAYTGPCDPCSLMEQNLGPGGLNAMRGHGGIIARVLAGGILSVGDEVRALPGS